MNSRTYDDPTGLRSLSALRGFPQKDMLNPNDRVYLVSIDCMPNWANSNEFSQTYRIFKFDYNNLHAAKSSFARLEKESSLLSEIQGMSSVNAENSSPIVLSLIEGGDGDLPLLEPISERSPDQGKDPTPPKSRSANMFMLGRAFAS